MNSNHPGTKFMYGDWILRILRTVFHCSRIVCPEGSSVERLWVIRNSNNNRRIIDIHSAWSTRRFFFGWTVECSLKACSISPFTDSLVGFIIFMYSDSFHSLPTRLPPLVQRYRFFVFQWFVSMRVLLCRMLSTTLHSLLQPFLLYVLEIRKIGPY